MSEQVQLQVPEPTSRVDDTLVVTEGLSKSFETGAGLIQAVDNVSITLPRGRLIAIRGASGSGKSTLLGLIGALDRATGGTLIVDGVEVTSLRGRAEVAYRRFKTGFIFQSFNLIPYLSAIENVMLPMDFAGIPKARQRERATRLLERVGIDDRRQNHHPSRLSGGQQQRVALARALMNEPVLLLADEPTANLDSKTGTKIIELLRNLTEDNRSVIVATHDQAIARQADVVVEMSDGQVANQRNRVKSR